MTSRKTRRQRSRWRRIARWSLAGVLTACAMWGILLISLYFYAKITGPPSIAVTQSTLLFSADGEVIGERHSGEKRYWQVISDISPHLIDATVTIEDRSFYTHNGFDFKRIGGAIVADIQAMAKVQGASTISQQYARNLFLSHDKTWIRKAREALYTIRLEWNYDKSVILEGYLNTIYYGHGAYGIEAASQYYFGKPSSDLSLAESAMLAGIPKSPTGYSPVNDFDAAKERQELILREMTKQAVITPEEEAKAAGEKITIKGEHSHTVAGFAPFFQDAVWAELETKIGLEPHVLKYGGLRIYTTLNVEHQKLAEDAADKHFPEESRLEGSLAVMEPGTGYVTALLGGRSYETSPFNRMTQAKRQPGSTIKPLLYTAALEHGFTPATTMRSEPTIFEYDGGEYAPQNFNHQFANEAITLAQAIAISDNIYAVKTHLFLGEQQLSKVTNRFGLSTPTSSLPSAALGTSEVIPIEMVNAYNILASGGAETAPVYVTRVETADGQLLYEHKKKKKSIVPSEQAFVMTHLLTGTFDPALNDYATVTGTSILEKKTREYAAKSGTTDTDQWMIGYSPSYTVGVWTGFDEGQALTAAEDKIVAKNVWIDLMEKVHAKQKEEWFVPPEGVVDVLMDANTGQIGDEACGSSRTIYFIEETEPLDSCQKDEQEAAIDQPEEADPLFDDLLPFFQ